eukprot:m.141311 g.141311  ORF g.141311 m.141311 type:complete len:720 (-) comp10020_c0_seq1:1541-3700(-)
MAAVVTPHKFALLLLLKQCGGKLDASTLEEDEGEVAHRLSLLLCDQIKDGTSHVELDLLTLLREVAALPGSNSGEAIAWRLVSELREIETPDEVFEHFDEVATLVMPLESGGDPPLARHSLLGLFVRRMLLAFKKMTFSQVSRLVQQLQQYLAAAEERNSSQSGSTTPTTGGPARINALSKQEAEQYLKQQAIILTQKTDQPSAESLQRKLDEMLQITPNLPQAFQLNYLNAMRTGNFSAALHNLHRHFDLQGVLDMHTAAHTSEKRRNFHNFTLALGTLHFHFGHWEEALNAIHETVRIAQENGDEQCLKHALGWLSRLGGSGHHTLAQLFVQRTEGDTHSLHALAQYNWARHLFGQGAPPARVLEAAEEGLKTASKASLFDLVSMGYMLKAGLWELYGNSGLASLAPQLHLHYNEYGTPEDLCDAYCKMAMSAACKAQFELASAILQQAQDKFPAGTLPARVWMATKAQLDHRRALAVCDWEAAEEHVMELSAALSTSWQSERNARFREVLLLQARGQFSTAVQLIRSLQASGLGATSCDSSGRALARAKQVTLNLTLAEIYRDSNSPLLGLSQGLRTMMLAEQHNLGTLRAVAAVLVAEFQLQLGLVQKAQDLLTSIMPQILAHGSHEARATAHLVNGRCQLQMLPGLQGQHKALASFEAAQRLFHKLGDLTQERKAFFYLARCHALIPGHEAQRNSCARSFRLLDQRLTSQGSRA